VAVADEDPLGPLAGHAVILDRRISKVGTGNNGSKRTHKKGVVMKRKGHTKLMSMSCRPLLRAHSLAAINH